MNMEQIECSETSAHTFQTPGSHPKEKLLHLEQGEFLKSNMLGCFYSGSNSRYGEGSVKKFCSV